MATAGSIAMAGAERTPLRRHAALALACSLLAAGLGLSLPAQAQGRHHHHHGGPRVHFGFVLGAPLYPYWYAPPPRYYYRQAPVVVVPAAPPVYIEQSPPVAQSPYPANVPNMPPSASSGDDAGAWWYFCPESGIYFPYVKRCAGGWQRVTPQVPQG